MINVLFVLVAVVLLALVAVLVAASRQPKQYRLERSMTTTASADTLYAIVSDLRRWPEWSPWNKYDPNMKMAYTGQPGEVGAAWSWEGNGQVGSGRNTIVAVQPGKQLDLKLEMYKPIAATNKVTWRIDDEGHQRRFTWIMEADHSTLMPRVMGLVMNMDRMVGGAFQEGLALLKGIAEKP